MESKEPSEKVDPNPEDLLVRDLASLDRKAGLNIPVDKFMRFNSFTPGGSYVTIVVGSAPGKTYTLPRGMLCYRVKYFEKVFMGDFKEKHDGVLVLDDVEIEPFELVMQWIFTDTIKLGDDYPQDTEGAEGDHISRLVDLIVLADRLLIDDDLTEQAMGQILNILEEESLSRLTSKAITGASTLRKGHPLRELIASYSSMAYLRSKLDGSNNKFLFENDLDENGNFALDVLDGVASILKRRKIVVEGSVRDGKVELRREPWGGGTLEF